MAVCAQAVEATEAGCVLDADRRLSESLLWRLQRRFFEGAGPRAWSQAVVPHYITSNPFMAQAYARVVIGYLRDLRAAGRLDPSQPVYVVELGAGSGRFGYHFVKKLEALQSRSPVRDVAVTHVLTDFAEANTAFWEAHAWLAPLCDAGRMDFALFDAEAPAELRLRRSGASLAAGDMRNPVIVLANYFFDSIPHDAFRIEGGELYENRVTVTHPGPVGDSLDPALLAGVRLVQESRRVAGGYFGDPELDLVLDAYRELPGAFTFLFPTAPLRCLQFFRRLTGDRLLLLSADKGFWTPEDVATRGEPGFAMHGSFSVSVNYHALGEYTRRQGGEVLHPEAAAAHVAVLGFRFDRDGGEAEETRYAFHEAVEGFGPDDFFCLKKGVETYYDRLTLEQLLAHLRLSGWDSNLFLGCVETLIARVGEAGEAERGALAEACRRTGETYFPIGESHDVPFQLARVLSRLGSHAEALSFLECSARLHPPNAATHYMTALCHYYLQQLPEARSAVSRALAADPTFEPARTLRITLRRPVE